MIFCIATGFVFGFVSSHLILDCQECVIKEGIIHFKNELIKIQKNKKCIKCKNRSDEEKILKARLETILESSDEDESADEEEKEGWFYNIISG